jgi:subtilase family serine protease
VTIGLVTLAIKKAPGQQTELDRFLDDLQNRSSPNYHRWLRPEEYADRFGASQNDIGKLTAWLSSEGLTVEGIARGRGWVSFSGTAADIERALHTELHRYLVDGEMHFAAAQEPSVPAALEPVVMGFTGLDDFEPKSQAILPLDNFTDGSHGLGPDDFATIYDALPLYATGIDGSGQKVAIAGRSDINIADIQGFRSHFNLPKNDPQLVLVGPDPGTTASQAEAILDLEWSGAVARNATILYVYAASPFNRGSIRRGQ